MLNMACSQYSGKALRSQSLSLPSRGLRRGLFRNLFLELAHLGAELAVAGLHEPVVEASDMLDRTQTMRRDAQLDALPEGVGDQGHVLQVRQERALRLVVGVGNVVTHLPALAGQLANPRHGLLPDFRVPDL